MIGSVIRALRDEHHYTQAQLSRLTGVPKSTIGRLELSKGIARQEIIVPIARAFNLTAAELYAHAGISPPSESELRGRNGHGGLRRLIPVRRCPYCKAELTLACQTKKLYRWHSLELELVQTICRRSECRDQAARDGWL